jgi:hypothetical protein
MAQRESVVDHGRYRYDEHSSSMATPAEMLQANQAHRRSAVLTDHERRALHEIQRGCWLKTPHCVVK